jgi:hypothetical protein
MNFDDLQSAWKNDQGDHVVIPDSVAKLRSVATPVERIRKNMRREFIVMICLIIGFAFVPTMDKKGALAPVPFYSMYAAMIILTIFYFVKFYLFYKRLNATTLSSKDNLYAVYYDIKLNIEMYRSFNYSIIPLLLLYQVMAVMSLPPVKLAAFNERSTYLITMSAIAFVFAIGIMIFFVELWVHYSYGKYLEQVRKILDELKEE